MASEEITTTLEALSDRLGALEVLLAEDKAASEAATKRYSARLREVKGMKDEVETMRELLSQGSRAPTLLERAEAEATAKLEAEG